MKEMSKHNKSNILTRKVEKVFKKIGLLLYTLNFIWKCIFHTQKMMIGTFLKLKRF